MERHRQWERDEELAQQQWKERQERLARAREEKAKQEVRSERIVLPFVVLISVTIIMYCLLE
jgi:hypothetical protein